MFNLDPKKMKSVMKQMGMAQEDIDASKVVIEKTDGSNIVISNPSVAKIKMQGQESFQISGDVSEAAAEVYTEKDVKTVMEKAGCERDEAIKVLEETGDLAEAILKLS